MTSIEIAIGDLIVRRDAIDRAIAALRDLDPEPRVETAAPKSAPTPAAKAPQYQRTWAQPAPKADRRSRGTRQAAVLQALGRLSPRESITTDELARRLTWPRKATENACQRARRNGLIVGEGRPIMWRLPKPSTGVPATPTIKVDGIELTPVFNGGKG